MIYLLHKMFFICMKSFFKLSFCDIDLEIIINYNINEKRNSHKRLALDFLEKNNYLNVRQNRVR